MATIDTEFHVILPFKFGDKVNLDGDGSIKGTVTGIAIYPRGFQIEVGWFSNGDVKSAWFADFRVTKVGA